MEADIVRILIIELKLTQANGSRGEKPETQSRRRLHQNASSPSQSFQSVSFNAMSFYIFQRRPSQITSNFLPSNVIAIWYQTRQKRFASSQSISVILLHFYWNMRRVEKQPSGRAKFHATKTLSTWNKKYKKNMMSIGGEMRRRTRTRRGRRREIRLRTKEKHLDHVPDVPLRLTQHIIKWILK